MKIFVISFVCLVSICVFVVDDLVVSQVQIELCIVCVQSYVSFSVYYFVGNVLEYCGERYFGDSKYYSDVKFCIEE